MHNAHPTLVNSEIMAISGHSWPEMVHAYDRRDIEDNVNDESESELKFYEWTALHSAG